MKTFRSVMTFLLGWFMRLIFNVRTVGKENEPKEGGFLVCSNHTSAVDPITIFVSMKHQILFMGKKELFMIPVAGLILRAFGGFPVDRKGNDVGAIRKSIKMLKDGECLGIFPQGTRCPGVDPRETQVKAGAAMIAAHAGATIVPVYVYRKGYRNGFLKRTVVAIGKPMPFDSFDYDPEKPGEYQRIANTVFDEVCKLGEEVEKCR